MKVNINNVETIEVADRDEAVLIIKNKMKAYMQKGDYLGWYNYMTREGEKPDVAHVYNEVGEETDDFAAIIFE